MNPLITRSGIFLALSLPAFAGDVALPLLVFLTGPFLVPLLGAWLASQLADRVAREWAQFVVVATSLSAFWLGLALFENQACDPRQGPGWLGGILVGSALLGMVPALLVSSLHRWTRGVSAWVLRTEDQIGALCDEEGWRRPPWPRDGYF